MKNSILILIPTNPLTLRLRSGPDPHFSWWNQPFDYAQEPRSPFPRFTFVLRGETYSKIANKKTATVARTVLS